MAKTAFFLLIFLIEANLYGQDSATAYQLKIEYNKKRASKRVPKSDSINIVFLYGYRADIVSLKTMEYEFVSDTLSADDLYGIGGSLKVPKRLLTERLKVYFNGLYVGALKVNKRYSLVHLEHDEGTRLFTWRYHKYRFLFL